MIVFLARRLMLALLTIWAVSVFSFAIIQLPPGDWFQSYIDGIRAQNVHITEKTARELVITLQKRYGVDKSMPIQYARWIWNIIQ